MVLRHLRQASINLILLLDNPVKNCKIISLIIYRMILNIIETIDSSSIYDETYVSELLVQSLIQIKGRSSQMKKIMKVTVSSLIVIETF